MPARWDEKLVLGLFRCVIKQQSSLKVDYDQLKRDMEAEYLPPGETVTLKALQLKWCDVRAKAKDKDGPKQPTTPRKARAQKASSTGSDDDHDRDEDHDAQAHEPTTPKKRGKNGKTAGGGSPAKKQRSPAKSREMDDFLVDDDDD